MSLQRRHVLQALCLLALLWAPQFSTAGDGLPVVPPLDMEGPAAVEGWLVAGTGQFQIEPRQDGGQAIAFNYDFSKSIDTQFRHVWERPQDLSAANGLRFEVRGDGSGQMLRVALITGEAGVDAEIFGRRVPIYLDFTGWREFFIPWEDFYLVPDFCDEISTLVFMFDFLDPKGPQNGSVAFDNIAFTNDSPGPSGFVELESDADFFKEIDLTRPGMAEVRRAAEVEDWPAAREAFVRAMRERREPVAFVEAEAIESLFPLYETHYGKSPASQRPRWENWANGNIDYINLKIDGPLRFDHLPQAHMHQIAVLHRFGWLPGLAQGYAHTGEPRYADKAVEGIRNFNDWRMGCEILGYREEQPKTSWGWPRDIDVGHRVQNWLRAYPYLKDYEGFDTDTQFEMFKALFHHAQWLYASNLPGFESWNHQIFRSIGLAETAILLPEFKRSAQWLEQAVDNLMEHLERETLADGAYFELTPGYGGGVVNAYLLLVHLARLNDIPLPDGFAERSIAMVDWFAGQVAPDGSLPATGDVRFGFRANKVLPLGAAVDDHPEWKFLGRPGTLDEEAFWLLGPDTLRHYLEMPATPPAWTDRKLAASGFLTLRSGWQSDSHFAFLNASVEGGGHAHPDSLQVDLHAYGTPILGDPGIPDWTDPAFPFHDSTRAHSLLQIDRLRVPTADPAITRWEVDGPDKHMAAQITYPDGTVHERSVSMSADGRIEITDTVDFGEKPKQPRLLEQIWRAAPGVAVSFEQGSATLRHPNGHGYRIQTTAETGETIEIGPDTERPDLDNIPEAAVVSLRTPEQKVVLRTEFIPFQ